MKKQIIILILALLIIPFTVKSVEIIGPDVTAQVIYTDPYPVEPGNEVTISIEISNSGNEQISDLVLDLKPSEPFSLLESPTKKINIINSGSSRIVEYKLFVDSSATSGTYKIPLYIFCEGTSAGMIKDLNVVVQGVPELRILNVSSNIKINPGSQSKLLVTVKNVGTGKAKKVTATFSSESEDIKPIFSQGIAYLDSIEPGQEKQFEFTIFVDSSTEFGSYDSDIEITYDDEAGNSLSENFNIGVLVSGAPDLQIIKSEVDSDNKELKIEIINSGSAKAIGVQATLIINNKTFDIDYITQIKIDKHATIKFNLPSGNKGQLKLEYKGPDNQEFVELEDVVWSNPFIFPSWLKGIIILLILYTIYRKKLWTKFISKKKK